MLYFGGPETGGLWFYYAHCAHATPATTETQSRYGAEDVCIFARTRDASERIESTKRGLCLPLAAERKNMLWCCGRESRDARGAVRVGLWSDVECDARYTGTTQRARRLLRGAKYVVYCKECARLGLPQQHNFSGRRTTA